MPLDFEAKTQSEDNSSNINCSLLAPVACEAMTYMMYTIPGIIMLIVHVIGYCIQYSNQRL